MRADDDPDADDSSLAAMLFREFVRHEIGAARAEAILRGADNAFELGWPGITVADEFDLCTCTIDSDSFSFRRQGWGPHSVSLAQARAIIAQELDHRSSD